MKKSYSSILLLVLVMILAISAVSAAEDIDTSDSDLQAVDEAPIEEVASEDVDALAATDDTDVVAADEGNNLTSLQSLIDEPDVGVYLEKDYVRVESDSPVQISDETIIFGQNHKIDGANLGEIFRISPGAKLTLQGLTIINAKSTIGGAIYNQGQLIIKNCIFEDNTASVYGGAIGSVGTGTVDISDSFFNYNTALKEGGAIYATGNLTIKNTEFNANTVTYSNESEGSYGGAISVNGAEKFEIVDSDFVANTATPDNHGYGGAIYSDSMIVTVSGTNFKSNRGFIGGAVFLEGVDQDVPVFDDCLFEENIALQSGAIQVISSKNLRVKDTTFKKNKAFSDRYIEQYADFGAGAVIGCADGSDAVIYINGSKFIENDVTSGPVPNSGFGAAVVSTGSVIVDNSEFTGNKAGKFATIRVYHGDGELRVTNSNFTGNTATEGDAAVIFASAGKNVYVDNSRFVDNTAAGNGGAIYASGNVNVANSYFANNIANNTSNSIYMNGGDLTLLGNTIAGDNAEIFVNQGKVISRY